MRFSKWIQGGKALGVGLLAAATLSACGGNGGGFVSGASARVYQLNGDQWVEGRIEIDVGAGFSLPSVTLPISPGGQNYGTVSVGPNLGGGGFVAVAVNLTTALRYPNFSSMLPNGLPIPLGGIGNVPIVGIPVGTAGTSRVYVAYGEAVAMLGAAVSIPALAPVGGNIGTTAILPAFSFGNVNGIAGLFTSPVPVQNGIALFMNLRGLLPAGLPAGGGGMALMRDGGGLHPTVSGNATLRYRGSMPSQSKRYRAWQEIERLRSQGAVLRAR